VWPAQQPGCPHITASTTFEEQQQKTLAVNNNATLITPLNTLFSKATTAPNFTSHDN
jgi:hypothetical protein